MKDSLRHQRKIKATLLLLAGGRGVRMGENKLYLEINGTPLIERILCALAPIFMETILLVSQGEKKKAREKLGNILDKYEVSVLEDEEEAFGPLEGLRVGLNNMTQKWGFLMGCDMPTAQENIIRYMSIYCAEETDVVAAERNGYIEPLHGFYSKNCLAAVQKSLKNKSQKIQLLYEDITLILLKKEQLQMYGNVKKSFFNINYPEDLLQMRKMPH